VQSTGALPCTEDRSTRRLGATTLANFDDYGVGGFLLAGSEVYQLVGGVVTPNGARARYGRNDGTSGTSEQEHDSRCTTAAGGSTSTSGTSSAGGSTATGGTTGAGGTTDTGGQRCGRFDQHGRTTNAAARRAGETSTTEDDLHRRTGATGGVTSARKQATVVQASSYQDLARIQASPASGPP